MLAKKRPPKYTPENLFPALRLFVDARNSAIEAGFTDNGGAIHSVERILDILSCRIKYPTLRHTNNYKTVDWSDRSVEAQKAISRGNGSDVKLEHVAPQRAFARQVIELIATKASNQEITRYILATYQLVLLTPEETVKLNKRNRSKLEDRRLEKSGIKVITPSQKQP